jgi:hypothetical protein
MCGVKKDKILLLVNLAHLHDQNILKWIWTIQKHDEEDIDVNQ